VRQYNDFLNKITSITKAMTGDLEIYQDYTTLYSDSSSVQKANSLFLTIQTAAERDVKTLFLVYGDILKLCTVVYSAFLNKKGKKRRRSHNILDHVRSLQVSQLLSVSSSRLGDRLIGSYPTSSPTFTIIDCRSRSMLYTPIVCITCRNA
jgi:hypothetical protein